MTAPAGTLPRRGPLMAALAGAARQVPRAPGIPLCTIEGNPDDWHPEHTGGRPPRSWYEQVEATKAICGRCPVRGWCWDTYRGEAHGIVAGTLPEDRGFPSTIRGRDRAARRQNAA